MANRVNERSIVSGASWPCQHLIWASTMTIMTETLTETLTESICGPLLNNLA